MALRSLAGVALEMDRILGEILYIDLHVYTYLVAIPGCWPSLAVTSFEI